MAFNRRSFLSSTCFTALGSFLPAFPAFALESPADADANSGTIAWSAPGLSFEFVISQQKLRQRSLVPSGFTRPMLATSFSSSSGVETALQVSGENSPDQGMKSAAGQPGARLTFVSQREEATANGKRLILTHSDATLNLQVESMYESFDGVPVVRRHSRITNNGATPAGIEFLSSAMLHGLADPQDFDRELKIHIAFNSWMAEGQWHTFRPSEMGFVENERTSWSQASAGSVGSWSSERTLPMAMVENTRLGLTWFWQIEHNGSWYWEISNVSSGGNNANDVYAYLGGPDDLHSAAWKNLKPGERYETVPVAIGCVQGSFVEAVEALTHYRRKFCQRPSAANQRCPVIFNDFMNSLWADPTEEKELPLIAAAAKAGCEYFVIDAGWYAELHEDWTPTIGAWQPSSSRWPHGLQFVLDKIKSAGMIPGLWLEPEVAGTRSILAAKPDNWFLVRHGKRVLKNSRLLLDFRNPQVRAYLDRVIDRVVHEYGVGYIKMDYNVDSLQGTELNADSFGQGLLEHNRAHLQWLTQVIDRYPQLIVENCGSGGGRMDYAMLSRLQIQSMTDQEDYLKLPAILVGSSAAVLPEQLATWSYPIENSTADQASFNMVTAMMCRIHQSGRLDKLAQAASAQVIEGIRVYKDQLREHIPSSVPFYPLGLPDVTNHQRPIALGMRSPDQTVVGAWRLSGPGHVVLPADMVRANKATLLYPRDLGIEITVSDGALMIDFPRPNMACLVML